MRTITFYSYKGGVGRSLLVANAAKYLSTLGKSVFAIDLDLEAPGLHYKFELDIDASKSDVAPGVVDILVKFLDRGTLPAHLGDYTRQINVADGAGRIQIMRAGTAPSGEYWRLLSQVNWYELLYGAQPVGAPFFLELKERIRAEYQPDCLLIDARTGITEMGGIATTLLPDTVVCLGLSSIEHLEGLRAVMQGIRQTTSLRGASVKLVPVISRLPAKRDDVEEVASALAFLNAQIRADVPSLQLDELITLHAEPLLDTREQLLVGGKGGPHELPLLRDYLRLFSKIIPEEDIRPHVGQLIQRAISRLLDDPDAAQSDLEALTTYCADREAYKALLKLYQVRKSPIEKILTTASLMWQLSAPSTKPDPLLVDIVQTAFAQPRITDAQKRYADFAEAIWRANGMQDIQIGMTLVQSYLPERRERAVRLLSDYVEKIDPPDNLAIVRLIDLLRTGPLPKEAFVTVERFKDSVDAPSFHAAWARLVLDQKDAIAAQTLLSDRSFKAEAARADDPATMYRLLKLVGDETAEPFLRDTLEAAITAEELGRLRSLGEIFMDERRLPEFEAKLHRRLAPSMIEEITEMLHRRTRARSRYYLNR